VLTKEIEGCLQRKGLTRGYVKSRGTQRKAGKDFKLKKMSKVQKKKKKKSTRKKKRISIPKNSRFERILEEEVGRGKNRY